MSSSEKNCSICLGSLDPKQGQAIFTAECSHSFHFVCITSNLKHGNQTCPICRATWKVNPFQAPSPSQLVPPPPPTWRQPSHFPRSRPVQLAAELVIFDDDEPLIEITAPSNLHVATNDGDPKAITTPSNLPVATNDGDPKAITIKTYPEFSSVQRDKYVDNFTVLIHLEAPIPGNVQSASQPSRTPIDLVTVLDVSGSMGGSKIALLKRAMGFVIDNLDSNDRLSIVSFSSTARRLIPLLRMTGSGRRQALDAVESLEADGGTNIAEGLRIGAKVMDERRVKNPVGSVILLSDGQDNFTNYNHDYYSNQNQTRLDYQLFIPTSLRGIPVYTFGFGKDHDASLLHAISELSGGTFSFIETEETIQDAFAQCIGGLLSVVVQELQVEVECIQQDTSILNLQAGSYQTQISNDRRSGHVKLGDLYAEGQRDFLVSLNIVPLSTLLLQVKCRYKDPFANIIVESEVEEVKIERPESVLEETVSVEVDRQRNRLQAAEAMSRARREAEQGNLEAASVVLQSYSETLASTTAAMVQDQYSLDLVAELEEMEESFASQSIYETSGRARVLSRISGHSKQMATTKGDSSYEGRVQPTSYSTSAIDAMLKLSRNTPGDPKPK